MALQGLQFLAAPPGPGAALPHLPGTNQRNGHGSNGVTAAGNPAGSSMPSALPGSPENPIVLYPPGYTNGHSGHAAAAANGAGRHLALPAGHAGAVNGALQLNGNGTIPIAAPQCVGGFDGQQEAGAMQQVSKRRAVGTTHPHPHAVHQGQSHAGPSNGVGANGSGGSAAHATLALRSAAKGAQHTGKQLQQQQQAAGSSNDQVSLLAWLCRPSRVVQPKDSFWIFTEVRPLLL
jgi:hypothetical protein